MAANSGNYITDYSGSIASANHQNIHDHIENETKFVATIGDGVVHRANFKNNPYIEMHIYESDDPKEAKKMFDDLEHLKNYESDKTRMAAPRILKNIYVPAREEDGVKVYNISEKVIQNLGDQEPSSHIHKLKRNGLELKEIISEDPRETYIQNDPTDALLSLNGTLMGRTLTDNESMIYANPLFIDPKRSLKRKKERQALVEGMTKGTNMPLEMIRSIAEFI